ncbi:TPA: glycosyltransferase family 4 protein, partial [Aeromonas hydrophila]
RTHWDKACVKDINQSINYYPCNETLREIFYTDTKWSINNCDEYTVFISQGHYSVKGLHNVIEAIFILKKKFPKVRLFVSGKNTQYSSMLKRFFLSTYYDKYIGGLIKRFDLVNNIFFTGPLCENGVHARLLSSHVYVCSSSIENSPNSLGEAMILGVPCVTSFVGGIPSLVDNEKEVLFYQHDAPYMLAAQIERIFLSSELAKKLSKNSIARAYLTHDADANNENLLNIYNSCLEGGK